MDGGEAILIRMHKLQNSRPISENNKFVLFIFVFVVICIPYCAKEDVLIEIKFAVFIAFSFNERKFNPKSV